MVNLEQVKMVVIRETYTWDFTEQWFAGRSCLAKNYFSPMEYEENMGGLLQGEWHGGSWP